MSSALASVDTPSDAELISAVRGGDTDAYGELCSRRSGGCTSTGLRAGARLQPTDDPTPFDPGVPFRDPAVEGFENNAAAGAFAWLPERWQLVLWHTEVEGQRPAEIAPLLDLTPNGVSALAYRAREGLRQAYLSRHTHRHAHDQAGCAWTHEHLGGYVRGGLSRRDASRVEEHLGGCHRCAAVWLELDDLDRGLAGLLAPLLLGAAAEGYVGSGAGGVSVAVGHVLGLAGRLRELATAHASATVASGMALGAAVVSGALLWPHCWPTVGPATGPATGGVTGETRGATGPGAGTRLVLSPYASSPGPTTDATSAATDPGTGPARPAATAAAPTSPSHAGSSAPHGHHQRDPDRSSAGRPDVDLQVRVNGLPPGGSTRLGVAAETGLLGDHPVRRRIVVGSSG